jgi:hypothetical protein
MQNSILNYCKKKEKGRKEKQTNRKNKRTNKHKKILCGLEILKCKNNLYMYLLIA